MKRLSGEPHFRLRCYCSPQHQATALHPLIGQIQRAAGFARDDTPEQKLTKLEALLAQSDARPEEIVLIAELLSIPSSVPIPELSPQKHKEKTLTALLAQLERLAARRPVLAVYEDVHWIDPTTLEVLALLIEQVQRLPVLLLITARPEFRPPWPPQAHTTTMTLGRIGREEGASLVRQVVGGKALPSEVLQQILARTDGVPLFIEELTKTVVESGVLTVAGDHYTVTAPLRQLAIPATLNASLLARLDHLAPVREVAQIASAIGRHFSHELISAVAPMRQEKVDQALEKLVGAELIFRRGTPPDAEYTFKHALVQDAVYDTLLRSRRQQIHARIVEALEQRFRGANEIQPELLAHHCAQAGLLEKAITYRYQAGRHAMARSAMVESVAQLTQALELLTGFPAGNERNQQEILVQVALGATLIATRGFAAPEVERAYERARELCRQRADHPELPAILFGLDLYHLHRSGTHVAYDVAAELLGMAEQRQDTNACSVGHRCLAVSALHSGKHELALRHFEQALAFYDQSEAWSPVFQSLSDVRVASLNFIPLILLWRGHLDQAVTGSRVALDAAQALGHAYTLSHVFHLNCWLHQHLGNQTTVRERAEVALKPPLSLSQTDAVGGDNA